MLVLSLFIYSISAQATDDVPNNPKNPSDPVTLTNPLGANVTPQIFIGKIIKAILGVVGSLALLMFIYGGFNIMTAAGTAEKVEKGKNILIWATIGLIIIFTSYALVKFVFTSLGV